MTTALSPARRKLLQLLRPAAPIVGHAIVARTLRDLGITHVFSAGGNPVNHTLGACARVGLRVIGARDQRGAVLMSLAYNYVSGALRSAVLVSAGPAVTNCATGILVGHDNRWPLLVLGGWRGCLRSGEFQALDGAGLLAPITKWSAAVERTDALAASIARAASVAMAGAPGPVYLDLQDVALDGSAPLGTVTPATAPGHEAPAAADTATPIDPLHLRAAVAMLRRARRPAMLIGKGLRWSPASESLRRLCDEWSIPFAASPMGRGQLPDDHPLCFSAIRARMLTEADLVLVIGARFDWTFRFGSEIAPQARVIRIDIDATEAAGVLGRGVGLAGDAARVLQQLLLALPDGDASPSLDRDAGWLEALGAARAARGCGAVPPGERGLRPWSPYEWLAEIEAALPDDAITVLDGNVVMTAAQRMLTVRHPVTRLGPGTNGCMGVGIPFAIGAKLARPDRPVVAIVGDFAFGLSAIELETAVRHRVPITVFVANNGGAGGANRQRACFPAGHEPVLQYTAGIRHDLTMASFGGRGVRVERPGQLGAVLADALAGDMPVCIDVTTNENTALTAAI